MCRDWLISRCASMMQEADPGTWRSGWRGWVIQWFSVTSPTSIADEEFDLVLCHAVLEWLDDPKSAVGDVALLVKQRGHLSLMFYNRFASLLKRTFAGDFETALRTIGPARSGGGGGKARPHWTTKWWCRGSKGRVWK